MTSWNQSTEDETKEQRRGAGEYTPNKEWNRNEEREKWREKWVVNQDSFKAEIMESSNLAKI